MIIKDLIPLKMEKQMKKILLITLCIGFAMTQSIQTKQIEVPVTQDTELIDISEYIDLGEGYYNVELIFVENLNFESESEFGFIYISPIQHGGRFAEFHVWPEFDNYTGEVIHYNSYNAYHPSIINQNNAVLTKGVWTGGGGFGNGNNADFSCTFIVNITGLFEDALLPPTGDLNLDGEINVVDVVVLVNSILGEE